MEGEHSGSRYSGKMIKNNNNNNNTGEGPLGNNIQHNGADMNRFQRGEYVQIIDDPTDRVYIVSSVQNPRYGGTNGYYELDKAFQPLMDHRRIVAGTKLKRSTQGQPITGGTKYRKRRVKKTKRSRPKSNKTKRKRKRISRK